MYVGEVVIRDLHLYVFFLLEFFEYVQSTRAAGFFKGVFRIRYVLEFSEHESRHYQKSVHEARLADIRHAPVYYDARVEDVGRPVLLSLFLGGAFPFKEFGKVEVEFFAFFHADTQPEVSENRIGEDVGRYLKVGVFEKMRDERVGEEVGYD